jgi:hypothetical protein
MDVIETPQELTAKQKWWATTGKLKRNQYQKTYIEKNHEAYKAYMRDYHRAYRARKKAEKEQEKKESP